MVIYEHTMSHQTLKVELLIEYQHCKIVLLVCELAWGVLLHGISRNNYTVSLFQLEELNSMKVWTLWGKKSQFSISVSV